MKIMKEYEEIVRREHIANLNKSIANMQVGNWYNCIDHWGKVRQVVAVAATYSGVQYVLYCVRNTNDVTEIHIGKINSNNPRKVILNVPDFEFARICERIAMLFTKPVLSTQNNIELMLHNYNDARDEMSTIDPIVYFTVVDSSVELSAIQ